jgi:hypothetical protein
MMGADLASVSADRADRETINLPGIAMKSTFSFPGRRQLSIGRSGAAVFTSTIDSDSSITGIFELKQGAILGDFTFTASRIE